MKDISDEYPEVGEFVIGTVKDIFKQGAFITLDEYGGKRGMLHLSEISLKWVRNIRDYVKEGQKVVVAVLRVDPRRGHIDLSLRRVSEKQKKEKLQQVKRRQRAEKMLEMLSEELKVEPLKVLETIEGEILKKYESLYLGLEAISVDSGKADELAIPKEWKTKLAELAEKNIKPPSVEITGYLKLTSHESDGVNRIRESLKKIKESTKEEDADVRYVSAPNYRITIKAADYKSAERILKDAVDNCLNFAKKNKVDASFSRELEK